MKSAARWLVKLHHLDTDCEGVGPQPDDETSIMNPVHRAESKEAWLSPRLGKLASLILMKLSFFKNSPITLVHGDFQCENIFVSKEKVTVIDFGKFCKSDPARDLGYMIAQARTMGLLDGKSFISLSPGLKAFWEEYQTSVSVEEREAFSARTCVFGALKCLENITYMAAYFIPGEKRKFFSFYSMIQSASLKRAVWKRCSYEAPFLENSPGTDGQIVSSRLKSYDDAEAISSF
jgi:hypothetical protein